MDIKPKFNENTITFSTPVKKDHFQAKVVKDPDGVISNGLYKVIRWEKNRQKIVLAVTSLVIIAASVLMALYATIYDVAWTAYVLPSIALCYALYKTLTTLAEGSWLKKSVTKYKEDKKIGLGAEPPLVTKLYVDLHKKQITHNWFSFFILFNGGILTLLLWWLKDSSWWIFDFKSWIHAWFGNPDLMVVLFTILLVSIATLHIVLSIQRKKRILDIDLYLGERLISTTDLETLKTTRNKAYRRLFIISLMIFLVIPMLVKITLKVLRKK